jgi:hypothetical protein
MAIIEGSDESTTFAGTCTTASSASLSASIGDDRQGISYERPEFNLVIAEPAVPPVATAAAAAADGGGGGGGDANVPQGKVSPAKEKMAFPTAAKRNKIKKEFDALCETEPLCGPRWVSGSVIRGVAHKDPKDDDDFRKVEVGMMGRKWGAGFAVDMHVFEGEKEVSSNRGPIGPVTGGEPIKRVKGHQSSYNVGRYNKHEIDV